jgi:hypothetical protein
MIGGQTQMQTRPVEIDGSEAVDGVAIDIAALGAQVPQHLLTARAVLEALSDGGVLPDQEAVEALARWTRAARDELAALEPGEPATVERLLAAARRRVSPEVVAMAQLERLAPLADDLDGLADVVVRAAKVRQALEDDGGPARAELEGLLSFLALVGENGAPEAIDRHAANVLAAGLTLSLCILPLVERLHRLLPSEADVRAELERAGSAEIETGALHPTPESPPQGAPSHIDDVDDQDDPDRTIDPSVSADKEPAPTKPEAPGSHAEIGFEQPGHRETGSPTEKASGLSANGDVISANGSGPDSEASFSVAPDPDATSPQPIVLEEPPGLAADTEPDGGGSDDESSERAETIAALMLRGLWSAAYWYARERPTRLLPADAVRIAALAVAADEGEAETTRELELTLHRTISSEDSPPSELIYAGAAMRLLSHHPHGIAISVLREGARDLERISPLLASTCGFLADRSAAGWFADLSTNEALRDAAAVEARRRELIERARHGIEAWPQEVQTYTPANQVWVRFSTRGGGLHQVLQLIADGSNDVGLLNERLAPFRNHKSLDREIDTVYSSVRRSPRARLEAKARRWIVDRVHRVVALATDWIGLVQQDQAVRRAAGEDTTALRAAIAERDENIQQAVAELRSQAAPLSAAAEVVQSGWTAFRSLVDGHQAAPGLRLSVDEALNGDLVLALGAVLSDKLEPVASKPELAEQLRTDAAQRSWEEAFDQRFDEGDHRSTGHALRRLEHAGAADDEGRRSRRDADIYARREQLRAAVERTKTRTSRLLACGVLTPQEFERYAAEIADIDADAALAFPAARRRLDLLSRGLDEGATLHARRLGERLEHARVEPAAAQRISSLIAGEQFDVADELLQRLERGEKVSDRELEAPDQLGAFQALFDGVTTTKAAEEVLSGAVQREGLDESEAREALLAVQQLGMLKTPARLSRDVLANRVRQVFATLGLDVARGTVKSGRGRPQYGEVTFDARPIGATWVPPHFGSAAAVDTRPSSNSRYRVLITRGQLRERELVTEVREHTNRNEAVIVLAVEPLTIARRRTLSRYARSEQVSFLLADSFSLLYQPCGRRLGAGTAAFDVWLSTALPFAWINPYVTQGNVPPEMFFGRREERRLLAEPGGSCFVYGGRQLGKSALLRTVCAQSTTDDGQSIGILIDLKAEGIGHRLPADHVWPVLARRLDDLGIGHASAEADSESVRRRLREWLEADGMRQVRLLLDEADGFLEQEAERDQFPNVLALRGLMEDTRRRFKVVFAGLHSVTRFRQIPNQPLAQFGGTSPVGPLSWADARDLVEIPMRAAGFQLDPPDLVNRILVESRRHPSLLQFVCKALIDHFSGSGTPRVGGTPVTITARQLDDVFERQDLRDRIRERFEWTLNLDPRYRVIALVMALRTHEEPELAADGLPARELWEQAVYYWPQGFPADGRNEFDVLLEEMVNLEVLAETAGRYRLPSSSVLRLLGGADEITDALLRAVEVPPPNRIEPSHMRRKLENDGPSPLTFREEELLLGVDDRPLRVVFGTPATRVATVTDALRAAAAEDGAPRLRDHGRLEVAKLAKALGGTKPGPRTVHLAKIVVRDLRQTTKGLHRLLDALTAHAARERGAVSVVLLVDDESLDAWAGLWEALEVDFEGRVRWLSLHRWTGRQLETWLDDFIPLDAGKRDRLIECTGGWPALLEQTVKDLGERSVEEAIEDHDRSSRLRTLLTELDVENGPRHAVASVLAEIGEADAPGLAAVIDNGLTEADVQTALDTLWLQRAATFDAASRQYRLDPTVAQALAAE